MLRGFLIIQMVLLTAGVLATHPARADDDRFTLRLGAIQIDGDANVNAALAFPDGSYAYSSGRIGFGERNEPRVEGIFRFSKRNRLLFNYFSVDNEEHYVLSDDLVVGEDTLPAGSTGTVETKLDLGSFVYDYALVETPNVSFGAQIGATWAHLKGSIAAGDEYVQGKSSETIKGAAPVVGLRLSTMSETRKWGFTVQAQYLDAGWGNLGSYDGDISRTNVLIEYRLTRNFGIYGGYDWLRVNANRTRNSDDVGIELRFMGPTAGMTLAF